MILKYVKKPQEVEAVQFNGTNHDKIKLLVGSVRYQLNNGVIFVLTMDMLREMLTESMWVVKHAPGRFEVLSSISFNRVYVEK